MDYQSRIREFVVDNFMFGDGDGLTDDVSFMGSGIVDSTGMLELIGFIEETYGVKVRDEELIPENFDSVSRLTKFVETKLGNKGGEKAG
ncbi:MAG: acyl carrier protein [Sedimentisphaerales bacterium]|nr:acyl carrier protein [Sedimentisphaerales bacterium]